MEFTLYKEPDVEDNNPTVLSIAKAFDMLDPDQEDPVVTLLCTEDDDIKQLTFQYVRDHSSGELGLSLYFSINYGNPGGKNYSKDPKDLNEVKEIFFNFLTKQQLPNLNLWDDDTEEDNKFQAEQTTELNIFKEAFKVHRSNGKEIYKGFGFKHLSDVTQYYVHPDNQSDFGTTSLCQPIAESVVFFSSLLSSIINEQKQFGDYFYNSDKYSFYMNFEVPEDWHNAKIIDKKINSYKIYWQENTKNHIRIAAYDKENEFIKDKMLPLTSLYKLLPCFVILLAKETETNADFALLIHNFIEAPAADILVNLCEDFYQNNKLDDFYISYNDQFPFFEKSKYSSCISTYEAVRENKKLIQTTLKADIKKFHPDSFKEIYLNLIPTLGIEFELQKELTGLCNAVQSSDVLAILFHGPAGTGKTIACKLVCQTIGLPVMDTINCTENLDEFILGKYIPKDDKIIFSESFVTKAIRDGGAVVFEEINFAKPQYLSFLNSLLDDNGFVRLDNGDVVNRHKNFRLFATMNLGYFGTKELNQALFNRFNSVIELAVLPDDNIKKMLSVRVPECVPFIDKMLGVYHKIKKKIESEELEIVISPRNLENWARLAQYEGYLRAADKTIIPIAKNDRSLEAAIKGIIYLYKWV